MTSTKLVILSSQQSKTAKDSSFTGVQKHGCTTNLLGLIKINAENAERIISGIRHRMDTECGGIDTGTAIF